MKKALCLIVLFGVIGFSGASMALTVTPTLISTRYVANFYEDEDGHQCYGYDWSYVTSFTVKTSGCPSGNTCYKSPIHSSNNLLIQIKVAVNVFPSSSEMLCYYWDKDESSWNVATWTENGCYPFTQGSTKYIWWQQDVWDTDDYWNPGYNYSSGNNYMAFGWYGLGWNFIKFFKS